MTDVDLVRITTLVRELHPALNRGDREKTNDIVRQLVALRAPMGGQWQQLAYIAAGNGEFTLAREAIDLLVTASGGGPAAQYQKVEFLILLNFWREADALLRTLPENVPDPVTNAYSRGTAAINLGRPDEARRYLEQVAQMRPESSYPWFALSMAVDFSREPELADRLIAAEPRMDRTSGPDLAPYYYALGKARAERGEHQLAFDAFAQGARHIRPAAAYDRDADLADAVQAVQGYTAERIAAIARQQQEPTGRTIFVTGLPRSGTTLLEQILTSHSAVGDGSETHRLFLLAGDVGGTSYPTLARYVEAQGTASAARIWDHWLDEGSGPGRIVDKTLTSSRYLGLAAALLPEAPLIWMTRDPLDRAWSCFRINFAGSAMSWSYDLEDIAAHFRIEDQLLAQWQQILGERLLVVPYEALVTDPASWIRRVLTHCGLAEEPQLFTPHLNPRPVTTASQMQVRRPINREGIGVAEPYRKFLAPFIEAYRGQ